MKQKHKKIVETLAKAFIKHKRSVRKEIIIKIKRNRTNQIESKDIVMLYILYEIFNYENKNHCLKLKWKK